MGKKKSNFINTSRAVKYMLEFTMENGKIWLLMKVFEKITRAVYPLASILLPGYIINELTQKKDIKIISIYIFLLAFSVFAGKGISDYISSVCFIHKNLLFIKFQKYLIDHIACVDFEYLEDPKILNLKESAYKCAYSDGAGFLGIIEKIADFFCNSISLLCISSIIFTLNPLIILLLILLIYINSIITKQINVLNHNLDIDKIPYERRSDYFSKIMQDFSYGKEIRVFGLKDFFIDHYNKQALEAHQYYKKSFQNNHKVSFASNLVVFMQTIFVYGYLVYEVIWKTMSIGNFTIYYSAISNFSNAFLNVVASYLDITRCSLYVDDLLAFMNLPRNQFISGSEIPLFHKDSVIEFKDVSFRYSGSERFALQNLNLKLRGNEKLCIVGMNGSGKTTFVKLLLRLYSPTSGEIFLNGRNINDYDYIQYQKLFAPVFQDFKLYAMTIEENISLDQKSSKDKIDACCQKSGFDSLINKLEKKELTQIYKIFCEDGIELSGGEAQKLGIARAIFRNSPVIVLDEPTAALDPLAEYEIYQKFTEMISDRSAILITHRLSAVQLSDHIALFHHGRLEEYGNHQELLSKDGIYAEMYRKQAEFYVSGEN